MNQKVLESKLADLPIGGVRYYDTIGSTNNVALNWADKGALDFSLVFANTQTDGRGRSGRKWFTYPGTGLAFSLILRPTRVEMREASRLTARFTGLSALAVCQVLQREYSLAAKIKWPNDVLVRDRKLCGVLVESQWMGDELSSIIMGVGINVTANSIPPDEVLNTVATSVVFEAGRQIDRFALLHQILSEIHTLRPQLLSEAFLRTWESNLAYREQLVEIVSEEGFNRKSSALFVKGKILGLGKDGALLIRTPSEELIALRYGEIINPGPQYSEENENRTIQERDARLRPVDKLIKPEPEPNPESKLSA
jgi:BirA family biotin operon repressor/biotin-[acetyl-CoA-carboxylase] ligase